jgi:hypothetical protein
MKFKVVGGEHFEAGVLYPKGSIIETDSPLDTMFECKFERIDNAVVASPIEVMPKLKKTEPEPVVEEEKPPVILPEGKMVDGLFRYAPEDTGLHVFRIGQQKYNVYDEDDYSKPLNDEPMTKSKTQTFLDVEIGE